MRDSGHPPEEDRTMKDLEEEASSRFRWKWDDTVIAGQSWRLAVAADPDGMLVEACQRQDAGEEGVIDPFWATTWRAAAGLDRFLDEVPVRGRRVLELGCGTGHAGIAAALRGARVVLSDGVEDPLHLVRMSVRPIGASCEVTRLRFGVDRYRRPGTQANELFPVILGSDVTYLRQLWPELLICLDDHLTADGNVFLSDPYRLIANEFTRWMADQPWILKEHRVELEDDPAHPIRVIQLRRRSSSGRDGSPV